MDLSATVKLIRFTGIMFFKVYHSLVYFSRRQIDYICLFISQKIGLDISSKLSPTDTICMKCQSLFSGENKKKCFNISSAENFTQHAKLSLGFPSLKRVIMCYAKQ